MKLNKAQIEMKHHSAKPSSELVSFILLLNRGQLLYTLRNFGITNADQENNITSIRNMKSKVTPMQL